jgi:CubicO group peptidase (beta-lactamase class C family)
LVERGEVGLDDLVVKHVPDLDLADPAVVDQLRVGHLVDHTAGWVGDVSGDDYYGDDALARSVDGIVATAQQVTAPGEVMSYNNAAFILLGRLIELVSGSSYTTAVRELVLEPLGLEETWLTPWDAAHRRLVVGHAEHEGAQVPQLDWPIDLGGLPAGGIVSSVRDQLSYARFHLHGGAALSTSTVHEMRQQRIGVRSGITGVGISWLLNRRGATDLVEHGGNVSNLHLSSFTLVPEADLAVTTLANCVGGKELAAGVVDHVLSSAGIQPAPLPTPLPLTPALRDQYVGRYDAGQWWLTIAESEGRLSVSQKLHDFDPPLPAEVVATFEGPPTALALVDPDVVAPADDLGKPSGDFIRGDDGSVRFLRHGLRVCRRVSD